MLKTFFVLNSAALLVCPTYDEHLLIYSNTNKKLHLHATSWISKKHDTEPKKATPEYELFDFIYIKFIMGK